MKKLLLLKSLLFLCTLLVGTSAWATDPTTITCTFSSKAWVANNGGTWTSGKDGNSMQSDRGIQITTGVTGANGTSGDTFSDVSQIVVTYSTNATAGAGSIAVKVGDGTAKSQNVTKSGGTTDRTLTYSFSPKESGKVNIAVTCTTNSIYVKSVAITYTPSSTPSSAATFASTTPSINWPTVSTYTQTATTAAGYTGTITYSIGSTNSAGASINGSTGEVTVTKGGSVQVIATAPAISGYLESSASYTLTVNDVRETVTLSWSSTSVEFLKDAVSYDLPSLNNPNSLEVTYSVTGTDGLASVTPAGVVTVNTGIAGKATVKASYAGNLTYKPKTASYTITVVDPTAKGSKYKPYTVAEVEEQAEATTLGDDIYVTGYIVGCVKDNKCYKTTTANLVNTNLLLADTPDVSFAEGANVASNSDGLIPVELPSGSIRTKWNIVSNNVMGYKVLFKGNAQSYYSTNGIKGISEISAVSVPVTIGSSKYAAYSSSCALDFTDTDVKAYKAKVNEGKVVLTQVDEVPANTGVILYCETVGDYDIPLASGTPAAVTENELIGVTSRTLVEWTTGGDGKKNYILQSGQFKKAATGGYLKANRAYLHTSYDVTTAGARDYLEFSFEDDVTGISDSTRLNDNEKLINDNCFDLQGRKVAQPTKGLYIVNGKKVIIK